MRWLTLVAAATLLVPSAALSADFSIDLLNPMEGLRECQISFARVPPKSKVDAIMNAAMGICTLVDNAHDVQVMAFKGDDALDDTQETYMYLAYDHKTRTIKRVTFNELLKNLKPIK